MTRLWKVSAIALLGLVTLAPTLFARNRGVVVVQPRYYRVYAYPYFGWGYGPYGPWWGPRPGYHYYAEPNTGEIKIETKRKGYAIYVDGGYAGRTGKLKKFRLPPGKHTIAFRTSDGRATYQESVYIIAGKTVKIYADFAR